VKITFEEFKIGKGIVNKSLTCPFFLKNCFTMANILF